MCLTGATGTTNGGYKVYRMKANPREKALIIDMECFYGLRDRTDTDVDARALSATQVYSYITRQLQRFKQLFRCLQLQFLPVTTALS